MRNASAQTSGLSRRKYQHAAAPAIANKTWFVVRWIVNPESTLDPASPSQSHGLQF